MRAQDDTPGATAPPPVVVDETRPRVAIDEARPRAATTATATPGPAVVETPAPLGRRFTALLYPHKPGMAESLCVWAREFGERTPGCVPTGTFYPEPSAARYVRKALDAGTRVFKAHVQVGAYDPRDGLLDPVWGMLAEAGVPVVVHCGSGPMPGEHTGPGPFGAVLARHPRLTAVIAHAGDGNTHPLIVFDPSDADQSERAHQAYGEVMSLAISLGGTITGEHGVGRLKKAWLGEQIGEDALELNRRVKQALDPQGILNPGAIL